MIVIIDNYDSFTYNLYQFIGHFEPQICVFRNDEVSLAQIADLSPSHLILSPGPKYPKDAGITLDAIRFFNGKLPILGVCLGHQSIGEAFGAKVIRAEEILHGKTSRITLNPKCELFKGLPEKVTVGRYHSLIVEKSSLTPALEIMAEDEKGEVMALKVKETPTFGLQFHPESILTPEGKSMIKNFLEVL